VSKRLERDRLQGRLKQAVDAVQATRLARVMAHGIVAQACHTATASGEVRLDALELCQSASDQLKQAAA
jgi:hypothetical protein